MLSGEACVWDEGETWTHGLALSDLGEIAQAFPKQAPEPTKRAVRTPDKRLGAASGDCLTAKRHHPGVSNRQNDQQVGGMLRRTNTTVAPVPTAAFEVTKTLFLPVAARILVSGQAVIIGHQRPRLVIADPPQGAGMG